MKIQHAPFLFGMHYIAHKINLVVQALSHLSIIAKFEDLFTKLCG